MINVYFLPGCYGTYFAQCVYNYTNLRTNTFRNFEFSNNGSSHSYRLNVDAWSVIQPRHFKQTDTIENNQIVSIVPCAEHRLDYYNNQFIKQQHGHLIDYVLTQMSYDSAKEKLKKQWNYTGEFNSTVPQWIMREWCSYWINDVLNSLYDPACYEGLNSVVQFTTQDIFENYINTLYKVVAKLELTITVDIDIINYQHTKFLTLQQFHNSQNKCHQYVTDLIAGNNSNMSLCSIFEEAYIQHLLRQHNLELKCDGLDTFPTTTQHLGTLIYETSNNNN
jgi:hypothetical protein